MRTRTIGNQTVGTTEVGAIGLGLMTFDQTGTQPRDQLVATVRAALDAGVTLFDTADAGTPTAPRSTSTRRSTTASSASGSTRSRCGSTTAPTRRCPTRTSSGR